MTSLTVPALLAIFAAQPAAPAERDTRLYELRVYYAAKGKLDALNARFRTQTMKLFEKHGMTNVAYWVPIDNSNNQLIYLLSYPNMQARKAAWGAFLADPAWRAVQAETEKDGKLVEKIDELFLVPTDYSPVVKPTMEKEGEARVFELRTYTTPPGRLDALHARFRDHTMKLFARHGMTNLWYWTLAEGQRGRDVTLVYVLAHKSLEAQKKSFDEFRKDPDWVAARTESEKKAGGPLTVKDGVKSVLLKPTDYSPMK